MALWAAKISLCTSVAVRAAHLDLDGAPLDLDGAPLDLDGGNLAGHRGTCGTPRDMRDTVGHLLGQGVDEKMLKIVGFYRCCSISWKLCFSKVCKFIGFYRLF